MELITHFLDFKGQGEIHLAIGEITSGEDEHMLFLTEKEREEYESFTHGNRKDEFLSTRKLIYMLGEHIGMDPDRMEVRKNPLGKPFGAYKDKRFYLSIAHSRLQILCGISGQHDIGVDLEPVGRLVHERLMERILHPDEYTLSTSVEPIRIWTIKEALVKLLGSGLRINLNEIKVEHRNGNYFSTIFNDEKRAKICSFEYQKHWISVAYFI